MNFVTPGVTWRGTDALYIARKLGQTANLRLCLDPGASASYDGTSQTFFDLSGGGNDYYRGTTSGSESTDPTFNGTAGRLTSGEYFSTDGTSRLTLVSGTNPSFAEQVHKDNAVFSIAMMLKSPAPGGSYQSPIGTRGSGVSCPGFELYIDPTSHFGFIAAKASNVAVKQLTMSATVTSAAWTFLAISLDEAVGTGGALLMRNGTIETFSSTYSSPTTDAAFNPLELLNAGGGSTFLPMKNGGALGPVWFWDKALKAGELRALYQAIRGRYGL